MTNRDWPRARCACGLCMISCSRYSTAQGILHLCYGTIPVVHSKLLITNASLKALIRAHTSVQQLPKICYHLPSSPFAGCGGDMAWYTKRLLLGDVK